MSKLKWVVVFLLCPFALPHIAYGQGRELLKIGKQASVLVEIVEKNGMSTATAFCIHPSGVFVTNEHVARHVSKGKTVRLIVDAGLEKERMVEALVVTVDSKSDLAILKVTSEEVFQTLKLGSNEDSFETMIVTAFGYPF